MEITRKEVDSLNTVLTLNLKKEDYQGKVDKILADYRKNANVPGFRKGRVPMGVIKKQYGHAVLLDEVNKLIQESMGDYLMKEKLNFLGRPLPVEQERIDWGADELNFEFELGMAPEFDVDLKKKSVIKYDIKADDKAVDNHIKLLQNQYGKHGVPAEGEAAAEEDSKVTPAPLDQGLFDKVLGEGAVSSEKDFREEIRQGLERHYGWQSDSTFFNDVIKTLLDNTKITLPEAFLTRYLADVSEEELADEAARKAHYEKNEEGIRYQLIEDKLLAQYELRPTFEDIKAHVKNLLKDRMAAYGQTLDEETLENMAGRAMSNREDVAQTEKELINQRLLKLFKENVKTKPKTVSYDDFLKKQQG